MTVTPDNVSYQRMETARQLADISVDELWWRYFSLGGSLTPAELGEFLTLGSVALDHPDILAHALNERFAERGLDHPVGYLDEGALGLGTAPTVDDARLVARTEDMVCHLLRASSYVEPDRLAPLVATEAFDSGLSEAVIFLVDHEQQVLTPLPGPHDYAELEIDATMAGRAFQSERPVAVAGEPGGWIVWAPLRDGTERLGVLRIGTPFVSDLLLVRLGDVAHAVAELLVSKSQYGDSLVLAKRRQEMSLSAELRWPVLPPLTFSSERTGIACVLEPAYDVAGDAFDYAANGDCLHFAIFDAMGHGMEATRMANAALAAYRAGRRRGYDLTRTYRLIDDTIASAFGDDRFVTGQLATLESETGILRWLSAGHPYPLLVRQGRAASELVAEPCLPMGMGGEPGEVRQVSLERGDRLLMFTDGVVEARSPGGERFGQQRLVDLTIRALSDRQTLAETARRLVRSVRLHREGELEDDATILFVSWS